VAIATFALIITVLYARATSNYFALPFGFESENIVTFRLDVPEHKYAEPLAAARVLTNIHERLQGLPSIKAAGASTRFPLSVVGGGLPTDALTIEDRADSPSEQSPWALTAAVTPGYFESLGVPLVHGRTFDTRESATSQPVAVISRSMARAYWPENEALGRRFRLASASESAPWLTVIGVVEDIRPFDPTSPQVRQVYLPFAQAASRALFYYVATPDPTSRLQDVRAAVRDVDPELPVLDLRTMRETLANQFSGVRLGQASIRVNAVIAVVMAISGVYSVVAFTVARRRREIAVRVALGGTRSAIASALLRQSLRPALIGVGLGLVFSALVSRAATLVLFGVNPLDPVTYVLTTSALCLAAGAASCIPVLKATRADSVVALRAE